MEVIKHRLSRERTMVGRGPPCTAVSFTADRWFETVFLHRRVSSEPDFLSRGRNPRLMAVRLELSAP
jgi:hypothetical protein